MKTAIVTGANGHIGANLVRELLANDYCVTAFVREKADLRGLEDARCERAVGDVLDPESVARAITPGAVVFHAAAPYLVWARDPSTIVRPAVEGTQNVLRAAKAAGAARVVVTSSCNAVGFTRDPAKPLDEQTWNQRATSPYMRAKLEQERTAHALGKELGLEVMCVLPTTVIGPFDYRKTPTTAPFVDMLTGKGPVPFPANLIDVRDVAIGHRLAAERGKPGERYLLAGDNVDMATLAGWIEKQVGHRPKEGLPPAWVLRAVATVSEAVSALSGKAPIITRAILDDVDGGVPLFDGSKARRELGFAPRGGEEIVAGLLAWAREMGWLGEAKAQSAGAAA